MRTSGGVVRIVGAEPAVDGVWARAAGPTAAAVSPPKSARPARSVMRSAECNEKRVDVEVAQD